MREVGLVKQASHRILHVLRTLERERRSICARESLAVLPTPNSSQFRSFVWIGMKEAQSAFGGCRAASSSRFRYAFLSCRGRDLDRVFSLQFERAVNRDNTVSFRNLSLQIEAVRWRATLAGCQVVVHQHLDGTLSLAYGPHLLGRYTAEGAALSATKMPARRAVEKTLRGKAPKQAFPPRVEIPQSTRDSHFTPATTAAG